MSWSENTWVSDPYAGETFWVKMPHKDQLVAAINCFNKFKWVKADYVQSLTGFDPSITPEIIDLNAIWGSQLLDDCDLMEFYDGPPSRD